MDYIKRWEKIGYIGEGGQSKVYKAIDKSKLNIKEKIYPRIRKTLQQLAAASLSKEDEKKALDDFRKSIMNLVKLEESKNHYALKVLHKAKNAVNAKTAQDRIKSEIKAMSKNLHTSLMSIIDYDKDGNWYVSKYFEKGSLNKNKEKFIGNPLESLQAIRPLIEAVSKLHERNIVHRDIKPDNVFIDDKDNLILGDFGLVFFDDGRTRYTETLENIGSRRWMPGWAMDMRIEDIKPSFDVFSLGKLLWAMISKEPVLRFWYFNNDRYPKYNLENMFPNNNEVKFINELLSKCIVEHEDNCLINAAKLLKEVDKILILLKSNADLIGDDIKRNCKVCGNGKYLLIVDKNAPTNLRNFGLNAVSGSTFKIFVCRNCGHVQLFSFRDGEENPAWKKG